MSRVPRFLEVAAIASMFAMTVSMYLVWAVAYLNGGSVTVVIDRFGETYLELVLWTFLVPLVALGLHAYLRREAGSGADRER